MKNTLWVVINDIQIPYENRRVLAMVVKFIKELRPYGIILAGDVVDCSSFSTYDKHPKTPRIEVEIDRARKLMKDLVESGAKEKYWLGGNHEDRLRRYLWRVAPALPLHNMDIPTLFGLDEFGFVWREWGKIKRLGKLIVTHGDIVRAHSGASAKAMFEKYGRSVLFGHTHRLGTYYVTNDNGMHVSGENGCLCRLDPGYTINPNWQNGFSIVHVGVNGDFDLKQIPILKGKHFFWGGKRIEG